MQDMENRSLVTPGHQITERYGLSLSQALLAELLSSTVGGLRYSLSDPRDHQNRAHKVCGRTTGRRVYCPANEVLRSFSELARYEQYHGPTAGAACTSSSTRTPTRMFAHAG